MTGGAGDEHLRAFSPPRRGRGAPEGDRPGAPTRLSDGDRDVVGMLGDRGALTAAPVDVAVPLLAQPHGDGLAVALMTDVRAAGRFLRAHRDLLDGPVGDVVLLLHGWHGWAMPFVADVARRTGATALSVWHDDGALEVAVDAAVGHWEDRGLSCDWLRVDGAVEPAATLEVRRGPAGPLVSRRV